MTEPRNAVCCAIIVNRALWCSPRFLADPRRQLHRRACFISKDLPTMTCGIYSITNTKSNKRYVGSASDIEKRWNRHRVDLRSGKHHSRHLQAAWNKYGESSFRFDVVTACEPGELIWQEQFWIDAFQAADEQHGYNCAPVASSRLGMRATEETRVKLSLSHKGYKPSDETRAKLSVASREAHSRPDIKAKIIAGLVGRKRSLESRAKISAARLGWQFSPETREKMSEAAKKRKASAATRAKMAASQRGQDGANAKLNDDDVRQIRKLLSSGMSQEQIARRFGVTQTCISHIKLGKNWSHVK